MNKAAQIVSEAITGDAGEWVTLRGRSYFIKPPTIQVICRAVRHFAGIESTETGATFAIAVQAIRTDHRPLIRGLAPLLAGDGALAPWRRVLYRYRLHHVTPREIRAATETAIRLIQGEDFFVSAVLAKSVAGTAAQPR